MLRTPSQLLDRLVAWHARRLLAQHDSHQTDCGRLEALIRGMPDAEAAAANPALIFPAPAVLTNGTVQVEEAPRLAGGLHQTFQMPSEGPTAIPENEVIWGRLIRPPGGDGGAVVLMLHPWIGPGGRLWAARIGRPFLRRGLAVATVEMPHHFHRTGKGNMSGELALCGDLVVMLESLVQCMTDLRRVVSWLRGQGFTRIATAGHSLGGWAAALLAAAEPEIHTAVASAPGVHPDRFITESRLASASIRRDFESSCVPPEHLARFARLASPLNYPPVPPSDRLLVIAPMYDILLPPSGFEELAAHWKCEVWRERHSHITQFLLSRCMTRLAAWIERRLRE
jgi:pimeloyl-ACP methyl ester carboxylesterase